MRILRNVSERWLCYVSKKGGAAMKGRIPVLLVVLMWAMMLMGMAITAQAQDLPEGVSVKVLAEFPSDKPGLEKIRLLEFRMAPGAKWENFVEDHTAL